LILGIAVLRIPQSPRDGDFEGDSERGGIVKSNLTCYQGF
jgi:hypothetical protein